jgi:serine/threonine-protein kinase
MANLYLARFAGVDGFEKLVAIKQVHKHLLEQTEFIEMFIDEARIASRISHPNVVQVLELGQVEGAHFMAMEYVEGENLNAIVRRGSIPERIGIRIVASAAAGLHAAHELRNKSGELLGVVHRDVSPQNILVSYEGEAKVTDFGIARAKDNLHVTTEGVVKGKFSYMAPEHARGEPIDRRADVFALGVVLFEITTGQRLFQGETEIDTVSLILHGGITRPSELVPDYPRELESIVMKALAARTADRFPTAEEMQRALEAYLARTSPPLLQSAVAAHMKGLFADRIAQKRDLLRQCEQVEPRPGSRSELTPATQGSPRSADPEAVGTRRGGFPPALILLLTVIVCAGVLGVVVWIKQRRHSAPAATKQILIAAQATPPEARLTLDGKPVPNPIREARPVSAGVAILRVSAPGHISQEYEVPLAAGCNLMVALSREPRIAPRPARDLGIPPPPRRAPGRKKRPRPTKDDDLFGDPYRAR